MKTFVSLCLAAASFITATSAQAALVLYTDRNAFNAATTERIVQPFAAPPGSFFDISGATVSGITYPEDAFMIDPGYAPIYDWGTGAVLGLGNSGTLSFAPTRAFAADFGTQRPGNTITVTIDGIATVISTLPRQQFAFYGWVSDTDFTSVSLSTAAQLIVLDNVTRGGAVVVTPPGDVPEPGSLALFGIGALLLARRCRRGVS